MTLLDQGTSFSLSNVSGWKKYLWPRWILGLFDGEEMRRDREHLVCVVLYSLGKDSTVREMSRVWPIYHRYGSTLYPLSTNRSLSLCLLTRESRKMTWRKMDVVHHERRKLRDREFLMKARRTFIRLTPDKLAVSWKLSIPERANMTSENRIDLL